MTAEQSPSKQWPCVATTTCDERGAPVERPEGESELEGDPDVTGPQ